MQTVTTCPTCQGRGKHARKKCKHCGGDGVLAKTSTIKVKIPAGIDNGQSIRLTGQGEAAPHQGVSGDLYVVVHIQPDKRFKRQGFDVYSEVEVNFPQAVLGDKVEVETLEGPVKIVIPEGTEAGQLIRLKGKGIMELGRSTRGDQYVEVKIHVPKKIDKETRVLLDKLKHLL